MSTHNEIAAQLRAAYSGATVDSFRDCLSAEDVDGAYAVQKINTDYWQQSGRRIVGRKIGLTSTAVQKQLGVNQPDFGVLFDDMRIEHQGVIPSGRLIQPKAEAEIALVLDQDLPDEDCTIERVYKAVEYAVCSIEIVDSRIRDWNITFADTVADNGSSAMFVLGQEKKKLADLDMYSCGMVMENNGEIVSVGAGAACLGHPLKAAAWLAQTLARQGHSLRAGDIVLTGALGPMISLSPGDNVKAVIGGLGRCSFYYEGPNHD